MPRSHVATHLLINSYRELRELYTSLVVHYFALGLVSVFIPIYLLVLGYSLAEVVISWIIIYAGIVAFFPVAGAITSRLGAKHTMLLSAPFRLLFLALLYAMQDNTAPIFLYFLVLSAAEALYWYPLNYDFASISHKKKRGKEVSYLYVAPRVGKVFAPVIGAALLLLVGFHNLFLIVIALLAVSFIPLFMSPDFGQGTHNQWKQAFNRKSLGYFFASMVDGAKTVLVAFVWPLFVYLSFLSTTPVGIASSITIVPVLLSGLLFANLADRGWHNSVMRVGAIFSAGIWLMAGFVGTPFEAFVLSFFAGLGGVAVIITVRRYAFNTIRKQSIEGGVLVREAGMSFGRVLLLLPLLALAPSFPEAFIAVFILASVLLLLLAFLDVRG